MTRIGGALAKPLGAALGQYLYFVKYVEHQIEMCYKAVVTSEKASSMKRNLEIGNRIRKLRESKGLSKSDLARQCGVTTTAVWNWEENGIVPRFETFGRLAKALGVSEIFLRTGAEGEASGRDTDSSRTVAVIIESARNEIASLTGMPLRNVRLNVEFMSS